VESESSGPHGETRWFIAIRYAPDNGPAGKLQAAQKAALQVAPLNRSAKISFNEANDGAEGSPIRILSPRAFMTLARGGTP